ncbi:MAG: DUF1349 domain-containing protein [Spirochaetota bacterium]
MSSSPGTPVTSARTICSSSAIRSRGDYEHVRRLQQTEAGRLIVLVERPARVAHCLERSPIGELVPQPGCYLRVTRKGDVVGMHYSLDGVAWRFVRTFGMDLPDAVTVGIHAQSPHAEGCRARFASFDINPPAVEDFRWGE